MRRSALILHGLLAIFTLVVVLAPAAAADVGSGAEWRYCVNRLDGQEFVCNEFHNTPAMNLCWNVSVNPPSPGAYAWNTLCTPVICPSWLCLIASPVEDAIVVPGPGIP